MWYECAHGLYDSHDSVITHLQRMSQRVGEFLMAWRQFGTVSGCRPNVKIPSYQYDITEIPIVNIRRSHDSLIFL